MASLPAEDKYGHDDGRFERAIDAHFHCSICYNVLKEPMMCINNEHIFCRCCITEHLTVNSHTCPECKQELTVETLRRAPRLVTNYLSELKINCDYSDRGCHEYIRLEELASHVVNCGFAPVTCSNEHCGMVVNKRELIHHKSTVCEYRKVMCHSCQTLEQDVKDLREKLKDIPEIKKDVDQIKELMVQMFEKLSLLENTIQISSAISHASNATLKIAIIIAGGYDSRAKPTKSVERFSWKSNVWERMSSMHVGRIGAISFVHENQLFVAGGCDNDVIEVLNLNEGQLEWNKSAIKLPQNCQLLRSVVYQNRAVLFCACDASDDIVELNLNEPCTSKRLCSIPETARNYTVVAFGYKVLIFGGLNDRLLDRVLAFDVRTNEFKVMPSLPSAVEHAAAVRWGDQAVLIGGANEDGTTNKVFMYDSNTGNTIELPSMLEERIGCAAVITGNTIVVMGGRGKSSRLKSVEAFTLGGYSWRNLPAMNVVRSGATASVVPNSY